MNEIPRLFRIGHGFVDYWLHEPAHWLTNERENIALADLEESLHRLIDVRDTVETARRGFFSASSLAPRVHITDVIQQPLFTATHNFFNEFYTTLSSFASFLSRFRTELEGDVPHRSTQKFLTWLRPRALMPDTALPVLEEARQFRTMLAHKASFPPYEWGTVVVEGRARIVLHGPLGESRSVPEGAMQSLDELDPLPEGSDWQFVAPDEDQVLAALAIQLNATFPLIARYRSDDHRLRTCRWVPEDRADTPAGGYPILAIASGVVAYQGSQRSAPRFLPKDVGRKPKDINGILAQYFTEGGATAKKDAAGNYTEN